MKEREHIWKQIINSAVMRFEAHPGDAFPVNFNIKIPIIVNNKVTIRNADKINSLEMTSELKTERPFNPWKTREVKFILELPKYLFPRSIFNTLKFSLLLRIVAEKWKLIVEVEQIFLSLSNGRTEKFPKLSFFPVKNRKSNW